MRKAFTLIELLAVIIILAIVALIATPAILDVIEDAKKSTSRSEAEILLKGAEQFYASSLLTGTNSELFDGTTNLLEDDTFKVSGEKPKGTLTIISEGKVSLAVVIEGYCYIKSYDSNLELGDNSNSSCQSKREIEVTTSNVVDNSKITVDITNPTGEEIKYCETNDSTCAPDQVTTNGSEITLRLEGNVTVCIIEGDSARNCKTYFIDKIGPIIEGLSPIYVALNETVDLLAGVTATDVNNASEVTVTPSSIDTSVAGIYTVTYESTDDYLNKTTSVRTIVVGIGVTVDFANSGEDWKTEDITSNITLNIPTEMEILDLKWCLSSDGDCTPDVSKEQPLIASISTNSGNNKVCLSFDIKLKTASDNLQEDVLYCSDSYKLDKETPTITAISEAISITKGDDNEVSSYFNVTYGVSSGSITCSPSNTSSLLLSSKSVACTATGGNGLSASALKTITIVSSKTDSDIYVALGTGMVPVQIAEDGTVYKADTSKQWYSYSESEWANAVTVNTASYRTAAAGTIIPMSAIEQMYVYIPRYKYKVFESSTPITIDIVFERKSSITGRHIALTSSAASVEGQYITHPAFYYTDTSGTTTELDGIWVGKFEQGAENNKIIPNVNSLTNLSVSDMYNSIRSMNGQNGLNGTSDIHMIKNTEWGAVAYLSQSNYGLCKTTPGTPCENVKIENNSFYNSTATDIVTGCGGNDTSVSTTNTGIDICPVDNRWTTVSGIKASTTHNITGIYDMAAGRAEFTMGVVDYYLDQAGFTTLPDKKYYDGYSSDTSGIEKGVLGDATKEVKPVGDTGSKAWNDDLMYSLSSSYYAWAFRGFWPSINSGAGVFGMNGTGPTGTSLVTSRSSIWIVQ